MGNLFNKAAVHGARTSRGNPICTVINTVAQLPKFLQGVTAETPDGLQDYCKNMFVISFTEVMGSPSSSPVSIQNREHLNSSSLEQDLTIKRSNRLTIIPAKAQTSSGMVGLAK